MQVANRRADVQHPCEHEAPMEGAPACGRDRARTCDPGTAPFQGSLGGSIWIVGCDFEAARPHYGVGVAAVSRRRKKAEVCFVVSSWVAKTARNVCSPFSCLPKTQNAPT